MALQNSSVWTMHTFLSETYHIPDYQREYSWEAEELGDFWDDLEATKKEPELIHFFGQIVVHNDENDGGKKYIIDGQQRTITSVIFLRALQLHYHRIYQDKGIEDANDKYSDIRSMYIGRNTDKSIPNKCFHLFLAYGVDILLEFDDGNHDGKLHESFYGYSCIRYEKTF